MKIPHRRTGPWVEQSSLSRDRIVNGRIAVAPAEFSIVTDMRVSLVRFGLVIDLELALLD